MAWKEQPSFTRVHVQLIFSSPEAEKHSGEKLAFSLTCPLGNKTSY